MSCKGKREDYNSQQINLKLCKAQETIACFDILLYILFKGVIFNI